MAVRCVESVELDSNWYRKLWALGPAGGRAPSTERATVILAAWSDPAVDQERIQWVRDYYNATAPHSEPGGYINFMDEDDQSRIRDNYKGNYDRLAAIKRTYDPDNLFHVNQNIAPGG